MTNWPTLKSLEIARGLKKAGFHITRQKGSHARFEHADGRATTLPVHADQDIGRGLFRKILRDVEMSIEDFKKFL
jgi:predicted RNA binding protein YcfA (HicA-like mRNA interferase family)